MQTQEFVALCEVAHISITLRSSMHDCVLDQSHRRNLVLQNKLCMHDVVAKIYFVHTTYTT